MNSEQSNELIMRFDPNTIEHLGIQMYATLPPVLAELISNAYDADAKHVRIDLNDESEKTIIVTDDGHGMSFSDINSKFLMIGRNRRKDEKTKAFSVQKTESGNRFAIGKKGLGKLSFFGIAKKVQVETIRNHVKNIFVLKWDDILSTNPPYKPQMIVFNEETDQPNGTTITLTDIQRKSDFDAHAIAYSLAKSFSIFDEEDFETVIFHNDLQECIVKNNLKFKNIDKEFEWNFPLSQFTSEYPYANKIQGQILSGTETMPADMKGIALFSRGKLVNSHEFYDNQASSFGYAYLTGFLDISFIDNWDKDVISTNRKSLNWEDEQAKNLREFLSKVIRFIYNDRKNKKKEKQAKEIEKKTGVVLDKWFKQLPKHEYILAKKITDSILSSEGLTTDKQSELVKFVKDSFQFEAFKEFAAELEELPTIDSSKIVQLMKDWELIENREMYKLALGRIQTIEKFKELINSNAYEVKEIHPFFEKFPWVLDPRINMFRHEAQYAELLKQEYPEKQVEEDNRRIDFLCTSVSNHKFVIELKRPKHKIKKEDVEQAKDYRSFIATHISNDKFSSNKVIAYIVGGSVAEDRLTTDEIETQQEADKVYVKSFNQLLVDAKNYHKEFVDKYLALTGQNPLEK